MDSHHGKKHVPDDFLVAERQTAYSLNRLTAAVNELSRLIEIRPPSVIERMLADFDNAAEYASAATESLHKRRLWRAQTVDDSRGRRHGGMHAEHHPAVCAETVAVDAHHHGRILRIRTWICDSYL
jgi:hypothetical protein